MSLFQTFVLFLVHRDFCRSEDAVVAEHWRMDGATTCSARVQVVATGPSTTTNLDLVATTSSRTGRAIDIICASFSIFETVANNHSIDLVDFTDSLRSGSK